MSKKPETDPQMVMAWIAAVLICGLLTTIAVDLPIGLWSLWQGHPTLMDPGTAVGGALRWVIGGLHASPDEIAMWKHYRGVLPPTAAWLAIDVLFLLAGIAATSVGWMRFDRWRARRRVGLPSWDPRGRVAARAWARPRDLIHLQDGAAGTPAYRRAAASATRLAYLGEASPALAGRVRTIDGLITAVEHDRARLDAHTTVYVDEAGMADTERLARLVALAEERGAALIAVGDARQLPSVGAGGMFERIQRLAPVAELIAVHRTEDAAEQRAWRALRDGDPARAMAHYRGRGQLRFAETRVDATDGAARRYVELAATHGHHRVALMSDASNAEIDALNLRVQRLRLERGDLSLGAVAHPLRNERFHAGDRVTWTEAMPLPGEPRVENGARGEVRAIDGPGLRVQLDGSGRHVDVTAADLARLRLGYASHVYRQQGATVDRALVVTGGWQTSREGAYVEASRARHGVEWHVARDELEGEDDSARVDELAARMRVSRAQEPSVAHELAAPAGGSGVALRVPRLSPSVDLSPAARELDLTP